MIRKKPLVGSVDLCERHIFLRHNQPASWPSKTEAPDCDPLPSELSNAMRSKKNELPRKTRVTVADGQDEPEKTNSDILLLPDMLKYKGVAESDVESFVDEVLVKGQMCGQGEPEPLEGSCVFICAYGSRDMWCGVCGRAFRECFNREITQRGQGEQVFVNYCSHIGGHKYAGNVVVFSRDGSGTGTSHLKMFWRFWRSTLVLDKQSTGSGGAKLYECIGDTLGVEHGLVDAGPEHG